MTGAVHHSNLFLVVVFYSYKTNLFQDSLCKFDFGVTVVCDLRVDDDRFSRNIQEFIQSHHTRDSSGPDTQTPSIRTVTKLTWHLEKILLLDWCILPVDWLFQPLIARFSFVAPYFVMSKVTSHSVILGQGSIVRWDRLPIPGNNRNPNCNLSLY